jgi:hypothetical protein
MSCFFFDGRLTEMFVMILFNRIFHFFCLFSRSIKEILLFIVIACELEEIMHRTSNTNNSKIAALASVTALTFFIVVASTNSAVYGQVERTNSFTSTDIDFVVEPKAPVVVSGDNIYIAWWTNNTSENGNEEVMFRASNDGGATFGDKINLSNTTEADSWRVEIAGEGADVVVSWWETNQTSDIPVARVSNDGGATFGPLLRLGMNGTIGAIEEEGEGEVTTATFGEEGEG